MDFLRVIDSLESKFRASLREFAVQCVLQMTPISVMDDVLVLFAFKSTLFDGDHVALRRLSAELVERQDGWIGILVQLSRLFVLDVAHVKAGRLHASFYAIVV